MIALKSIILRGAYKFVHLRRSMRQLDDIWMGSKTVNSCKNKN